MLYSVACSDSGPDGGGRDACFNAQRNSAEHEARIHLFNVGAAGNAGAIQAEFVGPGNQRQVCSPVSTDIASPTNVVFSLEPGQQVTVNLTRAANPLGSATCTAAADLYNPALPEEARGSTEFSFEVVGVGNQFVANIFCGGGFVF